MTENENTRPRGVTVYPMPAEVGGPFDLYALAIRVNPDLTVEARMVHTEGVAYKVDAERPWCWTDYSPAAKKWTTTELLAKRQDDDGVDLADWVRTFGARLESNFHQIYRWATEYTEVSH